MNQELYYSIAEYVVQLEKKNVIRNWFFFFNFKYINFVGGVKINQTFSWGAGYRKMLEAIEKKVKLCSWIYISMLV